MKIRRNVAEYDVIELSAYRRGMRLGALCGIVVGACFGLAVASQCGCTNEFIALAGDPCDEPGRSECIDADALRRCIGGEWRIEVCADSCAAGPLPFGSCATYEGLGQSRCDCRAEP